MFLPELKCSTRKTEYSRCDEYTIAAIVYEWLFTDSTHREIDRNILKIDSYKSKGFQSMSILHYLGLRHDIHSKFNGYSIGKVLELIENKRSEYFLIRHYLLIKQSFESQRILNEIDFQEIGKSQKRTSEERNERIRKANIKPEKINTCSTFYKRNPDIVAEALYRAHGVCENCKSKAPFLKKSDSTPYLEVHHIISLSNGGFDTLDNVEALCPNCHRMRHYG